MVSLADEQLTARYAPRVRRWLVFVAVLVVVASAGGCTEEDCSFTHLCGNSVRSACEIVSFATTCGSPITCGGGFCHIDPRVDEICAITVTFDDATTATTQVSITPARTCGCPNVVAKDFSVPLGSKCSQPSSGTDASTTDADALPDATDDSAVDATGQ